MAFYNSILVPVLLFLLRAFAPFIPKWQATIEARKGLLDRWRQRLSNETTEERVLVHVSSVGELEQILPVLREWEKISAVELIVSYFSPSIPRVYRDWSFAKYSDYLPLDREKDIREFFDIVQPSLLVLNRYDLWPNLMSVAQDRKIPIVLVNASTPPKGLVGKFGLYLRQALFSWISAWTFVDSVAAGAWEPYMGTDATALVTGDPRVDRAVQRAFEKDSPPKEVIQVRDQWLKAKDGHCIVAGSTWPQDETLLLDAFEQLENENFQLILVPHEPNSEHILRLQKDVKNYSGKSILLSQLMDDDFIQLNQDLIRNSNILIVDALGILSELYSLGHVAYVGGGFGRSVHSVIEPAAHRLPVAFGPNNERMPEARNLELMGGAYCVHSNSEVGLLVEWFRQSIPGGKRATKSRESLDLFLRLHRQAGERVAAFLEDQRVKNAKRKAESNR